MGLNHMNGRVQDAISGRFISPDPNIPDPMNTGDYNRYSYVNSNPMTFYDPSGFDYQSPYGQPWLPIIPRYEPPGRCFHCFYPSGSDTFLPFFDWASVFVAMRQAVFDPTGVYQGTTGGGTDSPAATHPGCIPGGRCGLDVDQRSIGTGKPALTRSGNTISGSIQVTCRLPAPLSCETVIAQLNQAWNASSEYGTVAIEFHEQGFFEEIGEFFGGYAVNHLNIAYQPPDGANRIGYMDGHTMYLYGNSTPRTPGHEAGHYFGLYDSYDGPNVLMGVSSPSPPMVATPLDIQALLGIF
jgi:hypothetical protein